MIDKECLEDLLCMSECLENLAKELKKMAKEYDDKRKKKMCVICFKISRINTYIERIKEYTEKDTYEEIYKKMENMLELFYICRLLKAYTYKVDCSEKKEKTLWNILLKIISEIECVESRIIEMFVDYNKAANGRSE